MIIAGIAYRDLPDKCKANVSELLQSHPEYIKWSASYPTNSPFDLATFVFMKASTWPDEIRSRKNAFDHEEWHYVFQPLMPPDFSDRPGPSPTNDIVFAISHCATVVKNKSLTPTMRAVHLSWLIHLVGDIHQPLHCVALVNSTYKAPKGDEGGKKFFVKDGKGDDLRAVWDKSLGARANPRAQYNAAVELATSLPRDRVSSGMVARTPAGWAKESRKVALEQAYRNGKLQGSTKAKEAPPLPTGYTRDVKRIAETRAVIAGYRLADELKTSLPCP